MNRIHSLEIERTPHQILESLPQTDYSQNFQPKYSNQQALLEAISELQNTEPVTNCSQIDLLQSRLTKIATGETPWPVTITGNCAEPVELETPISELAKKTISHHSTWIKSRVGGLWIERGRGQNAKPRSNEFEKTSTGETVVSYMGDAVNCRDESRRDPEPTRMVAAALQARDIEQMINSQIGTHHFAAHEALLLPYEKSFIRQNPTTDKRYLLSCDLPWIGLRTNHPDGPHVRLLKGVANPVGVKLGPDTSFELIEGLTEELNPERMPGKLVFMLRMGLERYDAMQRTVKAIRHVSSESLVVFDMHGSTVTLEDGSKVRIVEKIIQEAWLLAKTCGSLGMKLHGMHLETTTDSARLECVDNAEEVPTDDGNVDPQLNPRQTVRVLSEIARGL